MKLTVFRFKLLPNCTIGRLAIDGVDTGLFTLEPTHRTVKIMGETAIPAAIYKVIITFSSHFQRLLPLLVGVDNFVGVRMHPGNTDKDTKGCILLGRTWSGGDFIGESKDAFDYVFPKIQAARAREEVEIEIVDPKELG